MQLKDMVSMTRSPCPNTLRIKVLPEWIFKAITRNKLNVVDIEDYSKVRSFLSLEDLAILEYLNSRFNIGKSELQLATIDLFDVTKLTPATLKEYQAVQTLSRTDENKSVAYAKLSNPSDTNVLKDNSTYRFIPVQNFLVVIIGEGFIAEMSSPDKFKTFVSNYLEQCYLRAPSSDVAKLSMFNEYLRLL